jgi:hypothetical protein
MENRIVRKPDRQHHMNKLHLTVIAFIAALGSLACDIGLIPSKIQQAPIVLPGSGCAPVDVFGEKGAGVDDSCRRKQGDVEQWLTDWSDPKPTPLPGPTATPNCNPLPAQTAVVGRRYIVSPEQSRKEQQAQETRYPGQCKGGRFYDTKGISTPTRGR